MIAISLEDYAARSWAQTFQSLVPVDLPIAADAALALPALLAAVEDRLSTGTIARRRDRRARAERIAARHAALHAEWQAAVTLERSSAPLSPAVLAALVWQVIKDEDWVLANGSAKGWARRLWDWQPERVTGGSGGAGLGYGLPAALGVTLAHRDSGKLCVNLQADGDLLYVVGGLYTAAHHRLPLLTVMFNNRTYGNDEEHQETMAKARGRPVENKVVGIRIDDPAPDFARIAQGFGVHAEGPLDTRRRRRRGPSTGAPRGQGRGATRAGRRDHPAVRASSARGPGVARRPLGACRKTPARAMRRVQLRGGARRQPARRTFCGSLALARISDSLTSPPASARPT